MSTVYDEPSGGSMSTVYDERSNKQKPPWDYITYERWWALVDKDDGRVIQLHREKGDRGPFKYHWYVPVRVNIEVLAT